MHTYQFCIIVEYKTKIEVRRFIMLNTVKIQKIRPMNH